MAFANPKAALLSRVSSPPDTTEPGHPPTPERIATYCFPSGPRYVTGCPMIPEPVLNCQRILPVRASAALNQPSIVPKKTRSPAVTTVPLHVGYLSEIVQTFL